MPNIYYGVKELAQALGWDSAKVVMYKKRGHLIEPHGYVGEHGKRPVWTKKQVERMTLIYGGNVK